MINKNKKAVKTLAVVQIFSLVLEIFAFTFIFSLGIVDNLGGII